MCMALFDRLDLSSPDILDAIQRLVRDPAAAVRYTIAYDIGMLRSVETELMWCLIDDLAQNEQSLGVRFSLTQGRLDTLLTSSADDVDRVVGIVELNPRPDKWLDTKL